jgi:hypothetical protein
MDDLIAIAGESFDNVVLAGEIAGSAELVPLSRAVVERVTEGDDDPKFATFVIESGWSRSKRFWGPELFADVASEMNEAAWDGEPMVGYMGHIPETDDPYSFPEIQLQWVGAKLIERTADKAKLAVKAYVLPGTKARDYLHRGLVKSVSWRGKIAQETVKDGVRVKKFAIESIDLSRPRAAGMSARLVGALSSEMEMEGGNSVKPDEIAALQENELRAHNPALVQQIEATAVAPLETRVSEMTTEAEAVKPMTALIPDFRKLLGLKDDTTDENVLLAVMGEIRRAGKSLRDSVLDTVLDKKFGAQKSDPNFPLLRRAIVGEMSGRDLTLTGEADKDEQTVGEMVNSVIDSDTELKKVVSEMTVTPPTPPTGEPKSDGNSRELKVGYTNPNIRVRSAAR